MSGLQLLQNVADAVNAGTRTATNESSNTVSKIFNDIAADITTLLCSNVTVTDTLSEYVDIVEGITPKIAVYDGNGTEIETGNGSIDLESGQLTAGYDTETKKLTLDFPDGYELKAGYTYKVTVTIKPNDDAKTAYGERKGYPDTGDAGTDAEGNNTSSGQPGFYSNKEAEVSYTYNGKNQTEKYPMPVVQLSDETIKDIIGETPDPTTQDLHHEKYIKSNKDDGNTYDLTLTVSGKVGSETNLAKLDIMFILDLSSSMDNGWEKTKLQKAKDAVNSLVHAIDPKQVDAQWNLVKFASKADNAMGWMDSTGITKAVTNSSTRSDSEGGTNYQDAFVKAAAGLATARSEATKVVVFLTDGAPTIHLCSSHEHNRWGLNNNQCTTCKSLSNSGSPCGGGWTTTGANDYNGALMGANAIGAEGIKCDQFYAIGISLSNDIGYNNMSGSTLLANVANATNAAVKSAQNVDSNTLVDTFKKIAAEVTQFLCSDVTIQDTLSEYVEYIPGTDLVIEVKDKDGKVVFQGLNAVPVNGDARLTASYDKTTRQVILDFPDNYELKAGYVYSVTAKITPTDKAYDEYIKTGYPHTGDEKTDAPDNTTSSNKPGFYSNAEATVTYTYQEKEDSSEYDDPVVQVYKS